MTISGMTPRDKDAVSSFPKSLENKLGVNPTTAHDPDDSYVGGIGHSGCARQVSPGVRTPVAEKPH